MKHRYFLISTILVALALLLSAAYQPGLETLSGSALAAPAGLPAPSFRYLRTIGTTDVPYDTGVGGYQYLNDPFGIDVDENGNLYVAEGEGMRVLRYDSFQHANKIIGSPGMLVGLDETHFMWPADVLADGAGNFWVADEGRLTRFDSDGNVQIFYWPSGCEKGTLCAPYGLAFDAVGNLYVSDNVLNVTQVFMVDELNKNLVLLTTIDGSGEEGVPFNAPEHIDIDGSGNLYVADAGNNRVQKCTPPADAEQGGSWSCATFHGMEPDVEDGEIEVQLSGPGAVAVYGSTLYIADSGNGRVIACDLDTVVCNSSFITGLENLSDVAVDKDYVFVSINNPSYVVQRYSFDGAYLDDYAGTYGMPYAVAPDKIFWPHGLAVDRRGNVYVNETRGNRYLKYDAKGALVASAGTPGINKEFKGRLWGNPGVSEAGLLFLPDTNRFCVRIYTTSMISQNQTLGVCGSPGDSDVEFSNVAGVAVSPLNGNIYVVDMGNNKVKGFTSSLEPLGPLGGEASGTGDGDYQFSTPIGIAIDKDGSIYVADSGNQRVQKYNSRGEYLRTFGVTGVRGGSLDTLWSPNGVAIDLQNRVYIADTDNNRVQVFSPAGAYLATIGNSAGDWARPTGVAVAPNGTVYVAEWARHRIQVYSRVLP